MTQSTPIYHRAISTDDGVFVASLEAQIFDDAWDEHALSEIFGMMGAGGIGAFCDGVLIGYLLYQVSDVAQLLRIGTHPSHRRQGVAEQLLHHWLDVIQQKNDAMFGAPCFAILEVDTTNRAAVDLYQKFDFEMIHIRKNYYQNTHGHTDALIMQKALT